ncbi:thiamine-phosphate kinase [Pseudonocardia oceani]|uniref:Thiamine-monophosphate kinase n=1 Tax=Pseudonocardia oceani TaxID=2792013 RepID=A0ABS6UDS0_9PSEU|nr:thiamine-phosphate kinase [Pseudonocardia oceani]MBW0093418.1 thiamine-phosphate kinase [Pseudonocardia oceani]MBW0124537.1 thiamine-phosphate kinase [Pseudonocardia oceani]MBW0130339.1 thiamine-phosphate kinase [Pseudonocardia oceani]
MPTPSTPAEKKITLAALGEFGLISSVTAGRTQPASTLLGPGDDAAVVAAPDGRVVACTDVLVEGVHFRFDWSSPEQVGRKAAAANLADVAAMGAVPTALLVGLACPADTDVPVLQAITDGLWAEAAAAGAGVVGGDVAASSQLVLSVTALGSLEGRPPVTRGGARPGDVVAVAGRLGWAAAGWAVLARGFRSPVAVVGAHRVPEPPYAAGPQAARAGATSMIDVSDGLLADLGHVAGASGVVIDVRSSVFSVAGRLADVGQALGVDPVHWILTGGEDHALVATFPSGAPEGWTVIGSVSAGEPAVLVDGRPYEGGPAGWEHFSP